MRSASTCSDRRMVSAGSPAADTRLADIPQARTSVTIRNRCMVAPPFHVEKKATSIHRSDAGYSRDTDSRKRQVRVAGHGRVGRVFTRPTDRNLDAPKGVCHKLIATTMATRIAAIARKSVTGFVTSNREKMDLPVLIFMMTPSSVSRVEFSHASKSSCYVGQVSNLSGKFNTRPDRLETCPTTLNLERLGEVRSEAEIAQRRGIDC